MYLRNDTTDVLRIENEDKAHYIYIKHIVRLLSKNTHACGADRMMCPYCEQMSSSEDFEHSHTKKCYATVIEEGSLIELPEKEAQ